MLELGNLGRMAVVLYPGIRICALTFELLSTPSNNGSQKPAASGLSGRSKAYSMRGGGRDELPAYPQGQPDHHR